MPAKVRILCRRCLHDEARMTAAMRRILITGGAGEIGSTLRAGLKGIYPLLRLSDVRPMDAAAQDNAERYAQDFTAPVVLDPAAEFHGGPFCALEFDGDTQRID